MIWLLIIKKALKEDRLEFIVPNTNYQHLNYQTDYDMRIAIFKY